MHQLKLEIISPGRLGDDMSQNDRFERDGNKNLQD